MRELRQFILLCKAIYLYHYAYVFSAIICNTKATRCLHVLWGVSNHFNHHLEETAGCKPAAGFISWEEQALCIFYQGRNRQVYVHWWSMPSLGIAGRCRVVAQLCVTSQTGLPARNAAVHRPDSVAQMWGILPVVAHSSGVAAQCSRCW